MKKKAMIYGAGVSGESVKRLLEENNWETIIVDDKLGMTSEEAMLYLEKIDLFVKSPGVPYNKLVLEAKEKGIKIVGEIEVAYNYLRKNSKAKIIAITGTNGKTTTTSKIADLLNFVGIKSIAVGNIGKTFSQMVLSGKEYEYVVLELSSYQLENIYEFRPDIAMIINLAPDHLERYKDVGEYYKAKFNIIKNLRKEDYFILNIDDKKIVNSLEKLESNVVTVSLKEKATLYSEEGYLVYKGDPICKIEDFALKGEHNLQNILFISSVGKILGINNRTILTFLETTKSLEHRMELFYVDNMRKLRFINDSKGTNLESTLKAIMSFENPILICGGSDKKLDLAPLIEGIKTNIREVYLIGELAPKIEKELKKSGYLSRNIYNLGTLEKVVEKLVERNLKDIVVLFSPGTSSFDQFKNFEERGDFFKELIEKKFKIKENKK